VAGHRRGRHGPSHRTVVVAGVVVGVLLGGGLVAAAAIPLPKGAPTLALTVPPTPASATPVALPFPAQGEAALAIPTMHVVEATPDQASTPIASVTKLTATYVALEALPLSPEVQGQAPSYAQTGPSIVVTSEDVAEYRHDLKTNQSCVEVAAGEVLTERQLLDGMLVHSASNFASMLGVLVAGSDDEMVVKMNEAAQSLGMTSSSYVDVTGLDPGSVSSAVDVLHLAVLLMRNPTFAQIVRQPEVTLPVAGTVASFTPYVGKPHVVGIKSGNTDEAGGCDVMAYNALVAGRLVQIVDVVLNQFSPTPHPAIALNSNVAAAGRAALVLASAAAHHLAPWRVTTAGLPIGSIGWPSSSVPVAPLVTINVPTFDGVPSTATVLDVPWRSYEVLAHEVVAVINVTSGAYRGRSPIVATATLTRPSLWQRLR
jgi:serine-type D-Ala-D-Ala carboxypeptidase (penicillin-binding protein 5/6)